MIRICEAPKRFVAAKMHMHSPSSKTSRLLLQRNRSAFLATTAPMLRPQLHGMNDAHSVVRGSHSIAGRWYSSIPAHIPATPTATGAIHAADTVTHGDPDTMSLTGPRLDSWYTGKHPTKCPGFVSDTATGGYVTSLPLVSTVTTRAALQEYFDNTWCLTEILLGGLQGEAAFMAPPYHDLRHPMIFYYGHPAVLYVNKLRVAGVLTHGLNPYFEEIFETGVDEMSWDDLSKNKMQWPSVQEVHTYRAQVYALISKLIAGLTDEQLAGGGQESPLWALFMGMEHERIHIETSSVLISEMPLKFVARPAYFPPNHASVKLVAAEDTSDTGTSSAAAAVVPPPVPVAGTDFPVNRYLDVPATASVTLGKDANFPSFGFDNEYGRRSIPHVPAFAATQHLITNGDFLAFVQDNGYSRRECWSELGWKWKSYRNSKFPSFWVKNGPTGLPHTYNLRLLFELAQMPWDWPVSVNLHEASAYAVWKTLKANEGVSVNAHAHGAQQQQQQPELELYRLMTEVEHHAIRRHTAAAAASGAASGSELPLSEGVLLADPVMSYDGSTMMSSVRVCMCVYVREYVWCVVCVEYRYTVHTVMVILLLATIVTTTTTTIAWYKLELIARIDVPGTCPHKLLRDGDDVYRCLWKCLAVVSGLLLPSGRIRCAPSI